MTALWLWVVVASLGAWLAKVGGLAVPAEVLSHRRMRRLAGLVPVAVLASLAATSLVDGGGDWQLDPALLGGAALGIGATATGRVGVLGAFVAGCCATAVLRLLLG